jgi:hypothetical protein
MAQHIQLVKEHLHTLQIFTLIEDTLRVKCLKSNIGFLKKTSKILDISTNKEKYLLQVFTKDLVMPLTYYENLNQQLLKNNKQLLICTDNFVEYKNLSNIKFLCHRSLIGIKHFNIDPAYYNLLSDNRPGKLFNCFIHRAESVRQSWLYFLYHHNLIDRGYVSYLLYALAEYSNLSGVDLYDYIHNNYQLDRLPHFQEAYQHMRSKVPYQNFKENFKLADKIIDSKYSLVLDTNAADDDQNAWFFSEKTSRVLMLPTCQLLFLQKGTLTKLSKLGLAVHKFNLDIDLLSWTERQQKLLEILRNDSEEYNFTKLKTTALYNYNLLQSFYQEIDQFYNEAIDLAKSKFN